MIVGVGPSRMRSCGEGVLADDEDPDLDAALASPEMDMILSQGRSPQAAAGAAAEQQPAELRTQEYEPYDRRPITARSGHPVTAPVAADLRPAHSPYGRPPPTNNPAGGAGGGRRWQPSAWDYPLPRTAAAEEVVDLSSEGPRIEEIIELD